MSDFFPTFHLESISSIGSPIPFCSKLDRRFVSSIKIKELTELSKKQFQRQLWSLQYFFNITIYVKNGSNSKIHNFSIYPPIPTNSRSLGRKFCLLPKKRKLFCILKNYTIQISQFNFHLDADYPTLHFWIKS